MGCGQHLPGAARFSRSLAERELRTRPVPEKSRPPFVRGVGPLRARQHGGCSPIRSDPGRCWTWLAVLPDAARLPGSAARSPWLLGAAPRCPALPTAPRSAAPRFRAAGERCAGDKLPGERTASESHGEPRRALESPGERRRDSTQAGATSNGEYRPCTGLVVPACSNPLYSLTILSQE